MTGRRLPNVVMGAALWGLFAALVLGGGWLFLRACALDALGLYYCPVRARAEGGENGILRRAAAEGDALTREVHMAELSAAEAPVCAPPAPVAPVPAAPAPPPPVPTRPAPPQPAPAPLAETERIDRKVEERGGHNGRLQFTLEWATLDDLDLNVSCPGGVIDSRPGHAGPGICGDGRKDVDANGALVRNVSTTPIENVVWQTDIPSGIYQIEINEYMAQSSAGNTLPFTLRLRWNGQEKECHDSVTFLPLTPIVEDGDQVLGGTVKVLTWRFGEPLPSCDFATQNAHRGAPDK